MPKGERAFFCASGPIHVPSEHGWTNADTRIVFENGVFRTLNTWYDIEIDATNCALRYRSKHGGKVDISLWAIGDEYIGGKRLNFLPEVRYNQLWYKNIVPGVDIYIECRVAGIEIFKILHAESSTRSFTWRIDDKDKGDLRLGEETYGHDNYLRKPRQPIAHNQAPRRGLPLACKFSREGEFYREEWTGSIIERNDNRVPFLSQKAIYPIFIDAPDITEDIIDGADNGQVYRFAGTDYWNAGAATSIQSSSFAARFQSVGGGGFDSGSVINASTFFKVYASSGSAPGSATFGGDNTDNAAAWTNGQSLEGIGPTFDDTTAETSGHSGWTLYTMNDVDVQATVQEIVNREGWTDGNAMRLWNKTLLDSGSMRLSASSSPPTAQTAQLEIYYTPGAVGVSIPVVISHMKKQRIL